MCAAARELLAPDQRRHAAALAIAPVREEPLAIRERAPLSAADVGDAQRRQPAARETAEIRLPAAARIQLECSRCAGSAATNAARTSSPTSKCSREIAGPSQAVSSPPGTPSARTVLLEHAGGKPAPAGMRGGDARAVAAREQHRQAVRHHDHADAAAPRVTTASAPGG